MVMVVGSIKKPLASTYTESSKKKKQLRESRENGSQRQRNELPITSRSFCISVTLVSYLVGIVVHRS